MTLSPLIFINLKLSPNPAKQSTPEPDLWKGTASNTNALARKFSLVTLVSWQQQHLCFTKSISLRFKQMVRTFTVRGVCAMAKEAVVVVVVVVAGGGVCMGLDIVWRPRKLLLTCTRRIWADIQIWTEHRFYFQHFRFFVTCELVNRGAVQGFHMAHSN